MNIEVKSINDVLIMKINEECSYERFLEDLTTLLDMPIFQQDGYYPRAFFDFGCRQVEEDDIKKLIALIKKKKKVLFDGFNLSPSSHHLSLWKEQVRSGEEIHLYNETLFLGLVNPGSFIYCYEDVYFLNAVKGTLIFMNDNVHVYGHDFEHAQLIHNQENFQDLTTSALISVYYKDNQLNIKKEGVV